MSDDEVTEDDMVEIDLGDELDFEDDDMDLVDDELLVDDGGEMELNNNEIE